VVLSIFHLVGKGQSEGVDIELNQFFKNAERSGLWNQGGAATRSAFSKQRHKISPQAFHDIHHKAVQTALELWPTRPEDTWKGFSVFAIDGSKFVLPASHEIRTKYDPTCGLTQPGKGHFPRCLVSTLYDVFRRLPIARTVCPLETCEREEALKLLHSVPENGLVLYDRGYPSYEMLYAHLIQIPTHFVMRCPASSTFPAILPFIQSGKSEAILDIAPTKKARQTLPKSRRDSLPTLRVRVIRMEDPQGRLSVLITDLLDFQTYPREDLIDLYYKRWNIELYYKEEKIVLDVESFHSRTEKGILQELFAAMTMTVIARVMAAFTESIFHLPPEQVQAKNAIIALAQEAALLAPDHPENALAIFEALLNLMRRVKYYRPKKKRPSQPRITKKHRNKWIEHRKIPIPS